MVSLKMLRTIRSRKKWYIAIKCNIKAKRMGVISRHDTRKQYRNKKGKEKKINEFEANSKKRSVLGILQMYTTNRDGLPICNSLARYKIFTERSVKITSVSR
jgi:hypothetical protein